MFREGDYVVCEKIVFVDECFGIEEMKPYQIDQVFENGRNTKYQIENDEFFPTIIRENKCPFTGGTWVLYNPKKHEKGYQSFNDDSNDSEDFDENSFDDEFENSTSRGINVE